MMQLSINSFESMDLRIPSFQRIVDESKVNAICAFQMAIKNQYHSFSFVGCLVICKFDGAFYLVDGQHRFLALARLKNVYGHSDSDLTVYVCFIETTSLEHLKLIYDMINMNTPLPEFQCTDFEKREIRDICAYFQRMYPQVWSTSHKCNRPAMFFNCFQECVQFLLSHLNGDSLSVRQLIVRYNEKLAGWKITQFPSNVSEHMHKTAQKWGFFLGLFLMESYEEYCYPWVKNIVEFETGVVLKRVGKSGKKKTIPRTLRNAVWKQAVGDNLNDHLCICCQNERINALLYHCGHIVAESKGGSTTMDNLLPVCSVCNLSMRDMNMHEFIQKTFPENEHDFLTRTYYPHDDSAANENKSSSRGLLAAFFG